MSTLIIDQKPILKNTLFHGEYLFPREDNKKKIGKNIKTKTKNKNKKQTKKSKQTKQNKKNRLNSLSSLRTFPRSILWIP